MPQIRRGKSPLRIISQKVREVRRSPPNPNPKQRSRRLTSKSLFDKIIFIKVGVQATRFGIHQGLLCHHSAYFQNVLHGPTEEVLTGTVTLTEEDPAIFQHFNQWLYTGKLLPEIKASDNDDWDTLMEISLFADRITAPGLHNAAIDLHIQGSVQTNQIPIPLFRHVWSNTDKTSLLRGFLIALTVRAGNVTDLCRSKSDRAHFSLDMVVEMLEYAQEILRSEGIMPTPFDFWEKRCMWHVHKEGELCEDEKK